MSNIFISYRPNDSAAAAGHIYDRLVAEFGKAAVIKDAAPPPGSDVKRHIEDLIDECDAVLVVVGPRWLDTTAPNGQRCVDDPNDAVRVEIEAGLRQRIPVIPLLVDGATVPTEDRLPPSLHRLVVRGGIPIRYDPDFADDMRRVVSVVDRWTTPLPIVTVPRPDAPQATLQLRTPRRQQHPKSRGRVYLALAVFALLAIVGYGLLLKVRTSIAAGQFVTQDTFSGVALSRTGDVWVVGGLGVIGHYSDGSWTVVHNMDPSATLRLSGVAAIPGSDDAWAVGDHGAVLKLSGNSASQQMPPPTDNNLKAVAMVSPTEGWAVGDVILHYSNGRWTEAPSAQQPGPGVTLYTISMDSATDGWAAGGTSIAPAIMHFSGGKWKKVEIPDDIAKQISTRMITGLSAVAGGQFWAVLAPLTTDILHYDNGHWEFQNGITLNSRSSDTGELLSITMSSATDGWAVGYLDQNGLSDLGLILHYDGNSWSQVYALKTQESKLTAIAMVSATDGWAVGQDGLLLRDVGGVWTQD